MGLTRAQKIKKYGDRAGEVPAGGPGRRERSAAAAPARRNTELPAPEPTKVKRQPGVLIAVIMVIGALLMFYVNVLIMPEFSAMVAEDHGVPELQVIGYDQAWFEQFARIIGDDGAQLYASVHWGIGLLAPLVMAAGWALFMVIYAKRGYERWSGLIVTALFLVVYLVGNAVVQQAVADAGNGALVTFSSVLISTRWVLLVVLMAVTFGIFFRKMRERLQNFDPVAANEERKRRFGR